ncbi:MAG: hypothetical protein AB7O84_23140, partial [Planctomycetota bacterium]
MPRFRCKTCLKTFSRQTFRIDYRDRRPECNEPLLRLLVSGVGLRQAGRMVRLTVHAVQKKFRKIARHQRQLHRNLLRRLPAGRTLLFDETESFELRRFSRLTIPMLIDKESLLVVDLRVAPIRRRARRGSRTERKQRRHEARHGRRRDLGRACVRRAMGRLETLLDGRAATLVTDQKTLYGSECRRRFGTRVSHDAYSGKAPRTSFNPLFCINLTESMLRDGNGRLHSRSWLASKRARYLALQLAAYQAYRNWVRPR